MPSEIYYALKALVTRIPWYKVAKFLGRAWDLATAAARLAYSEAKAILSSFLIIHQRLLTIS